MSDFHSEKNLSGKEVLLVEDNEINQLVAVEMLETFGIITDMAVNGHEAVVKIEKYADRYMAVLMDVQMPVMDGYEATRIIREKLGRRDIPIIAMTAHSLENERMLCFNAGMNDYLSKPIDPRKLHDILVKWLYACNDPDPYVAEHKLHGEEYNHLNYATLLDRFKGKEYFIVRLLDEFRKTHSHDADLLSAAYKNNDMPEMMHLAHNLKGVAGNLHMADLFSISKEIEDAVKHEHYDQIMSSVSALRRTLEKYINDINANIPLTK